MLSRSAARGPGAAGAAARFLQNISKHQHQRSLTATIAWRCSERGSKRRLVTRVRRNSMAEIHKSKQRGRRVRLHAARGPVWPMRCMEQNRNIVKRKIRAARASDAAPAPSRLMRRSSVVGTRALPHHGQQLDLRHGPLPPWIGWFLQAYVRSAGAGRSIPSSRPKRLRPFGAAAKRRDRGPALTRSLHSARCPRRRAPVGMTDHSSRVRRAGRTEDKRCTPVLAIAEVGAPRSRRNPSAEARAYERLRKLEHIPVVFVDNRASVG